MDGHVMIYEGIDTIRVVTLVKYNFMVMSDYSVR